MASLYVSSFTWCKNAPFYQKLKILKFEFCRQEKTRKNTSGFSLITLVFLSLIVAINFSCFLPGTIFMMSNYTSAHYWRPLWPMLCSMVGLVSNGEFSLWSAYKLTCSNHKTSRFTHLIWQECVSTVLSAMWDHTCRRAKVCWPEEMHGAHGQKAHEAYR